MEEIIEAVKKIDPLTDMGVIETLMKRIQYVNTNDPRYKELVTALHAKGLF